MVWYGRIYAPKQEAKKIFKQIAFEADKRLFKEKASMIRRAINAYNADVAQDEDWEKYGPQAKKGAGSKRKAQGSGNRSKKRRRE